jgi:hypothetical protein
MTEGQNAGKNKHANPAFHLQVGFSRPITNCELPAIQTDVTPCFVAAPA